MQISKFLKYFKRISSDLGWVSIVIGKHGVHFVRTIRAGARVQIEMCEFYPTDNLTSSELERLTKEFHLTTYQFTTLLSSEEYQILMVDAPNVPVAEMKAAVRYRIKDSLSY